MTAIRVAKSKQIFDFYVPNALFSSTFMMHYIPSALFGMKAQMVPTTDRIVERDMISHITTLSLVEMPFPNSLSANATGKLLRTCKKNFEYRKRLQTGQGG